MPGKQHEPAPRTETASRDREKPLREQLHEAVNANLLQTVKQGIDGIDQLKVLGVKELKRRGIVDMEEIANSAGDLLKKLLIRGISK